MTEETKTGEEAGISAGPDAVTPDVPGDCSEREGDGSIVTIGEVACDSPIPLYQHRVIEEKDELDSKILKLNAFLSSDLYDGLQEDERARLRKQHILMKQYSEVLGERIKAFA